MARNRQNSREFAKRKNLLDIRHQRCMNYFNISMISLITVAFSSVIGYFSKAITFELMATFLLVDFLLFGSMSLRAHTGMKKALGEITGL